MSSNTGGSSAPVPWGPHWLPIDFLNESQAAADDRLRSRHLDLPKSVRTKLQMAPKAAGGHFCSWIFFLWLVTFFSCWGNRLCFAAMTAAASTAEKAETPAQNAVDGDMATRWSSQFSDPQWLEVSLGEKKDFSGLIIKWEAAYASQYRVEILESAEPEKWKTVFEEKSGDGGTDNVFFPATQAEKFRIWSAKRATTWGCSILEVIPLSSKEIPGITAVSSSPDSPVSWAMDGQDETAWTSGAKGEQRLEISLNTIKPIGGIFIQWGERYASSYSIEAQTGNEWKKVFETQTGNGGKDKIYFESSSPQTLRINMNGEVPFQIKEITFKGGDEQWNPQKYFEVLAEEMPKGFFPRWLYKEQEYWTVVGAPNDDMESLLSEDGDIEPVPDSFTISPFIFLKEKVFKPIDVKINQSLEKNYLPVSNVVWEFENLKLEITAFAWGETGKTTTYARYTLSNSSDAPQSGKFYLAVRPLLINPPWQHGGISSISSVEFKKENLSFEVNGRERIVLDRIPDLAGTSTSQEGDVAEKIRFGKIPSASQSKDSRGLASAAWAYSFHLEKNEKISFLIALPLNYATSRPDPAQFEQLKNETIGFWEEKLNRFQISIPSDERWTDVMRSNLAYLLIHKDGPALQPGSRNYERAWMRDGAVIATSLLHAGISDEVREFLDWYESFQEADGEIPAVVSPIDGQRDRIKEYDSQGEWVYPVLQYYQFSKDKKWLAAKFPAIKKSLEYLEKLRGQRLTEVYSEKHPDKMKFHGILPESVSHEGYYPEPGKHSYWDDFWALRGWKDGQEIARILARKDSLSWMQMQENGLRQSVLASIALVCKRRKLDFIPGCAELGDFDATSTAIAVAPCDEYKFLPEKSLNRTFDIYLKDFRRRQRPGWNGAFTPYEIRSAQSLQVLGRSKDALEMLRYFLTVMRPQGWNHWAEVVFSDPRQPQYLGDMPHGWVGAEFINAFRVLFVYETAGKLVLAAGLDPAWIQNEKGVEVKLPTEYGEIHYRIFKNGKKIKFQADGNAKPPAGFVVYNPGTPKNIEFKKLPEELDL